MPATTTAEAPTSAKFEFDTQLDTALSTTPKPSFPGYPFTTKSELDVPSSDAGLFSKLSSIRGNLELPSPGSFEALHRESRGKFLSGCSFRRRVAVVVRV